MMSGMQPSSDVGSEGTTRTVQVQLAERSYPIYFSSRSLQSNTEQVLGAIKGLSHVFVVADLAVVSPHVEQVTQAIDQLRLRSTLCIVPSGEASKSIEQLSQIWNMMLESKADRSSVVIAVGGGVVGDLAGFAAASFARGLRFVQIPTTLLAMVDSSVGGKTGINLPNAKNMVGAFWQPSAVIIDTATLDTLADREFQSGLAEVVKYGVILDAEFFDYIERNSILILQRDPQCLEQLIERSCQLKARVVEQDERETTGLRAILNYGHTFAHAIEAATDYGRLLHGEAVAIGMTMAAQLAVRLGMFQKSDADRQRKLLEQLRLPTAFSEVPGERLWELMQYDKKVEQGVLGFILPTKIGHVQRHSGVVASDAIAAMKS
ncbi:MAG: 3-dehydroquinate synthase [Pirellulaceae bacterium]|nr:3-dehydroquinate synthase [Pirellulaceae bacterium]